MLILYALEFEGVQDITINIEESNLEVARNLHKEITSTILKCRLSD